MEISGDSRVGLHGGVILTSAVTEQKLSEWCFHALKANIFKLLQGAQSFCVTLYFLLLQNVA